MSHRDATRQTTATALGETDRQKVGVSEAALAGDGQTLVTSGLGSCLGVALYHPNADAGALLHAMLPESSDHPGPPEKFVVDGIDAVLDELEAAGVPRTGLRAKLAGASSMLDLEREEQTVGEQNVAAAKRHLEAHHITIEAADTGGTQGRSLEFDPASGRLVVRRANDDRRVL